MPRLIGTPPTPAWTFQVVEALALFDQPLSGRQLVDLIGAKTNQISATLHYLQKKRVIDAILTQEEPFWFLTGEDARVRHDDEARAPKTRARKTGYASKHRAAGTLVKPAPRRKKGLE